MPGRATAIRSPGRAAERIWTTAGYSEPEQLSAWSQTVAETFVPVDISREAAGPFTSSVRTRRVGTITVATVTAERHVARRWPSDIDREAGDVFFVNLPLTGGASASQDGRTAHLAPGDLVLVDSTRPFELRFERDFRQVSLTIPHVLLAPLLAVSTSVTAIRVPGDHGAGAVAAAAIRALADAGPSGDAQTDRSLGERVADLVALSVAGSCRPPQRTGRARLLHLALEEIDRSFRDPDLSPGTVAGRIGISTRYLHDLFAEAGTSFGKRLADLRLDRSRRDLEDPARVHWTIAHIASENGFRDPAYYSRAFKARFGLTPREARRSALPR